MFHYLSTLTDQKGNSLPRYQVEVVELEDGQTVVPIFSDENQTPIEAVSGIPNRALTDQIGNFDFFVENGTYSIRFYDDQGGFLRTQRYLPFYGAPTNGGGGGDVAVRQDGIDIVPAASALNFSGSVAVNDGGGGVANITVAGGGLARRDAFPSDGGNSYPLELSLPVSLVTLDGLAQPSSAFSVAGQVITFAESVPNGTLIDVYYGDTETGGGGGDTTPSIVVNSIAVIEARESPSVGDAVYLNEGSAGPMTVSGWFRFSDANLSSQVSADPAQLDYIAPDSDPTGASGAWVRKYSRPFIFETGERSGASYTLQPGDELAYVRLTGAGGCQLTIPKDVFRVGTVITIHSTAAASQVLLDTDVTATAPGGGVAPFSFLEENATIQIKQYAANAWDIIGGIEGTI